MNTSNRKGKALQGFEGQPNTQGNDSDRSIHSRINSPSSKGYSDGMIILREAISDCISVMVQSTEWETKTEMEGKEQSVELYRNVMDNHFGDIVEDIAQIGLREYTKKEAAPLGDVVVFGKSTHVVESKTVSDWGRWFKTSIDLTIMTRRNDEECGPYFFSRRLDTITLQIGVLWTGISWTCMNTLITSEEKTEKQRREIADSRWIKERIRLTEGLSSKVMTELILLNEGKNEEMIPVFETILPQITQDLMEQMGFKIHTSDSKNLWLPALHTIDSDIQSSGNAVMVRFSVNTQQRFKGRWTERERVIATLNFQRELDGKWRNSEETAWINAGRLTAIDLEQGNVVGQRLIVGEEDDISSQDSLNRNIGNQSEAHEQEIIDSIEGGLG